MIGPAATELASVYRNPENEADLKLGGHFVQKGFTPQQAKVKAVWENSQIAAICSQMYHHTYRDTQMALDAFSQIPEAVRQNLAVLDYTAAERVCPHRLPITQLMRQADELLV